MNNETTVLCPLCKGSKTSPYAPFNTCKTCEGIGTISQSKNTAITQIRLNLAKRMKAKGIEL